jgi:uncharacterized membrane protein
VDGMILLLIISFFIIVLFLSTIVHKLEQIRKNSQVQMDQNDRIVDLLKEMIAANKNKST